MAVTTRYKGMLTTNSAGETHGRRSTTGFIFTLNGGPVSWARKHQATVATSTAEAEYVAAAIENKEALWLWKLLLALGATGGDVPMGEENQSCLALVNNHDAARRTKHVDLACHMIRDYQARGDVASYFLPSAECRRTGSQSRCRRRLSRLLWLPSGTVKTWARLRVLPTLATPCWENAEAPWRHWKRPVAQPRFCGCSLLHRCCGPVLAVVGFATVHLRGDGHGAQLRGASTRRTAGWDRPGALRRNSGRPVAQLQV